MKKDKLEYKEIYPCAHCGNTPKVEKVTLNYLATGGLAAKQVKYKCSIKCIKCGSTIEGKGISFYEAYKKALSKWNLRDYDLIIQEIDKIDNPASFYGYRYAVEYSQGYEHALNRVYAAIDKIGNH